ncbi:hypothetical protein [Streptomyces levis]|uniref:hypothetical protein n=1 Tax=Streptomyces levis TaxID=285566 RepID=UPI003C7DE835
MISGLSAGPDAPALGEAEVVAPPASAPAISSLLFELSSPLPQAVNSSTAVAVSAAATGNVRRFTVAPRERTEVQYEH